MIIRKHVLYMPEDNLIYAFIKNNSNYKILETLRIEIKNMPAYMIDIEYEDHSGRSFVDDDVEKLSNLRKTCVQEDNMQPFLMALDDMSGFEVPELREEVFPPGTKEKKKKKRVGAAEIFGNIIDFNAKRGNKK